MLFIFLQRALVPIAFISAFIFTGCSSKPIEEKQINVVFRFDDPSARSSTEIELRVIDAFREHNASITFGVIPFVSTGSAGDPSPQGVVPLGQKKGQLLKKAVEEGVLDISLHGYSHQTIGSEYNREFMDLDYNKQLEKLTKGKKYLEEMIGVSPTAFVPPWNKYDQNTLKALEVLGFSTLSAAITKKSTHSSKLNFLPFTAELYDLHDAVEEARASSDKQPLIVVLFHAYDFKETGSERSIISFEKFYDLLGWIKSQKDVRILSVSQASKEITDLSAKRFQAAKQNYSLEILLPSFLKNPRYLYAESPCLIKTILKIILLHLFIIVLGILLSYFVVCVVFQKSEKLMKISTYGNVIMSSAIIIYAIQDLFLHFKETAGIAIFVGFSIGSWICFRKVKKKSE